MTDQQTYGMGVVGCGSISDTHADAIQHTSKGKLVSAYSRTGTNRDRFCLKYNVAGFDDYSAFLQQSDLDIVVICTPTGTHLDYGVAAAKAGKHVVVEKPVETTVNRGRELIESCADNDVKLAVIYQNRFLDEILDMKQFLENGGLGDIFMAKGSVMWYRDQEYYSGSNWRGTFTYDGGGAVINQSIHTIDLLQWLMGGVQSVQGVKGTYTHDIEAEDNAVAVFRYKNGAIGTFEASTSINPPNERRIEIYGTNGTAILEGDRFTVKRAGEKEKSSGSEASAGASSPLAGLGFENHKKQYDNILSAIRAGNDPPVSGKESLQSLAVVEAIYLSAEKGEPVHIDSLLSS
jgi:UDP-N-acetyl-2-amino-2-deoxyglucuronate dehydrogenase